MRRQQGRPPRLPKQARIETFLRTHANEKIFDADRLKTEIGELDNQFRTGNYYLDNSEQAVGYQNALTDICGIIDSLQQEQPDTAVGKVFTNTDPMNLYVESDKWNTLLGQFENGQQVRIILVKED